MTQKQIYKTFGIDDLRDLPDAVTKVIEQDIVARNAFYSELLTINNNDLSHDWFQGAYEEELAQRKQSKQDFTPNSISRLASLLTGNKGYVYEPTAGNGSMLIADWWKRRKQCATPWDYRTGQNLFTCWELSPRAIPLLLLNLSIRGMMGYVFHGDVLTMEVKCKYVLLNRDNDSMGFSEIIKDLQNEWWIEEQTQGQPAKLLYV